MSSTPIKGGVSTHTAFSTAFCSYIRCSAGIPWLFPPFLAALPAAGNNSHCLVVIPTAPRSPTCCRQQFPLLSASPQHLQQLLVSLRWSPDAAYDVSEAGKRHTLEDHAARANFIEICSPSTEQRARAVHAHWLSQLPPGQPANGSPNPHRPGSALQQALLVKLPN